MSPHLRNRAVFTLSRALFRKNVGALHLGQQTLFFLGKTGNLFLVIAIRCQFSSKTGDLLSPIISGMQTFALPFVGPVWPNMLKSAAVKKTYITHLQERQTPRN